MPDVGIVMPVYKQDPDYLTIALQSILRQSYQNYYLTIVSDGAPAETVALIKQLIDGDSRVNLIIKGQNEGVAKALNTGFDHLMEKKDIQYLTWVSSDNKYYPEFISKLRITLKTAAPNVGLSYSSFRHIDQDGFYIQDKRLENFHKYQDQPKENLLDVCFIGVSFMYTKQVASKIGGYRLEPVEDYDYWLRLTEHCEIVYTDEALMEYRRNSHYSVSAQLKSSKEQERRWRNAFNFAKKEARMRRNIPETLTIIFLSFGSVELVIKRIETVLDQSFSNYRLIVVDRSADATLKKSLAGVPDPRLDILTMKHASEAEAIKLGMNEVKTPFAMLYGKKATLQNNLALQEMMKAGVRLVNKQTPAVLDTEFHYVEYGRLYRAKALKNISKKL